MKQTPVDSAVPKKEDIEKLARSFALEFLTGHYRELRADEKRSFDELVTIMLAFNAQAGVRKEKEVVPHDCLQEKENKRLLAEAMEHPGVRDVEEVFGVVHPCTEETRTKRSKIYGKRQHAS